MHGPPPWQQGPSILSLLRARDGASALELPDEPPSFGVRFQKPAPDAPSAEEAASTAVDALYRLVAEDSDEARYGLYSSLQAPKQYSYEPALMTALRHRLKTQRLPKE